MNLIIVESPTKSKSISRFLGKDYQAISSYGHIRDLPKSELGVDVEHNFKPKYIIPTKVRSRVKELKEAAKKAELIILATDMDREGEAIAWHILQVLDSTKTKNYQRIAFHEITKSAIKEALKNPRQIDMKLVNAQQARRILDRLVGYELSPFLWKKIVRGLSAGRVQSVTVRLIIDREKEIKDFKPEEYWSIEAKLRKQNDKDEFIARLIKKDEKAIPKLGIKTKKETDKILKDLKGATYKIIDIVSKKVQRHPAPPFTTSTLQQEAVRKLGFSAKQTMRIAQQLYEGTKIGQEGLIGLITYHRTDSLNLSGQALKTAQEFIKNKFGQNYALASPRVYRTKTKGAQEAHEAIRPTQANRQPEDIKQYLNTHQYKLYNLIWCRFIACQMSAALLEATTVNIQAKNYIFRTTGSIIKFDGFLKIYPTKFKETILPPLTENELLELIKLFSEQHFTQPPARYSEASLVKTLEEYGIGRPSTYAPIISTIQERGYVEKNDQRKFIPTEIGFLVNNLLVENFPKIVDVKFTAQMENDLDKIAAGEEKWTTIVNDFYQPFHDNLLQKYETVEKKKLEEPTDKKCPKCGKPIIIKLGRFGKFYACSGFPECKYTEPIIVSTGVKCPKCDQGKIIEKKTKKGKIFYSCSRYPKCDFALWDKPNGEKCPKCDSLLVQTKNNKIKCSNKECDFKPVEKK
ncbi:MAG: type I DNA topoisomerase [Candidatus Portnoybacteria bacterium]|nr:type I DNA topoisomerase [Candidatus Portnoybacteria bacterium]